MKLNLEKDVKAAVEINNVKFIEADNSVLYQSIENNEIFLYIRSNNESKEIKIRITKFEENVDNKS